MGRLGMMGLGVALLIVMAGRASHGDSAWDITKKVMNASVDVNGDRRPERIALTALDDSGRFRLTVNNVAVSGDSDEGAKVSGFYLANIDRGDRYKEIVVYNEGPSEDYTHMVYWFDGRHLRLSGRLCGWIGYQGNGHLMAHGWTGHWEPVFHWRLSRQHKLQLLKARYYPVNIQATVYRPLELLAHKNGRRIAARLPRGRRVTVVKCDLWSSKEWYYVRSHGGSRGWITGKQLERHLGDMPSAD